MSEKIRVRICDRKHPHFNKTGVLTGKIIQFKHWDGKMAEVEFDDTCERSGERGCFVNPGQVERWR